MIDKNEIHRIVEIFYQPRFMTFYINSLDGKSYSTPIGVFVSLGISTPIQKLEDIRKILEESGYKAKLSEIETKTVAGQFMNSLTNLENISQYSEDSIPEGAFGKEGLEEILKDLKNKVNKNSSIEVIQEILPKISQLQGIKKKLDYSGWENHLVRETDGGYKLFHTKVNYRVDKDNGNEYRIGIFVTEK